MRYGTRRVRYGRLRTPYLRGLAAIVSDVLEVTTGEGWVRFEVHARPRAKTSAVRGVRQGALDVALAAPPVDGAANDELRRFLARSLGLPTSAVQVLRGHTSRTKLVEIRGITSDQLHVLKEGMAAKAPKRQREEKGG